jgi:hypothetical protein
MNWRGWGYQAQLAKGQGYFYFQGGEAADWIDNRRESAKAQ